MIAFQIYQLAEEDYDLYEAGLPVRHPTRLAIRERINMLREEADKKGYNIYSRPYVRIKS